MSMSKKMVGVMYKLSTFTPTHFYHEAKTIEGLKARGLIKNVKFMPRAPRDTMRKKHGLFRYSLTKKGLKFARAIHFMPLEILEEIAS